MKERYRKPLHEWTDADLAEYAIDHPLAEKRTREMVESAKYEFMGRVKDAIDSAAM